MSPIDDGAFAGFELAQRLFFRIGRQRPDANRSDGLGIDFAGAIVLAVKIQRLFHAATFAEESEKTPDPPDPFPSPKFRTSLAFAVELLNEPALLQLVHEAQIDEILRLGLCGLRIQAGLDLQGVF